MAILGSGPSSATTFLKHATFETRDAENDCFGRLIKKSDFLSKLGAQNLPRGPGEVVEVISAHALDD